LWKKEVLLSSGQNRLEIQCHIVKNTQTAFSVILPTGHELKLFMRHERHDIRTTSF